MNGIFIYLDNLCDGMSKYLDNQWMISINLDNLCDGISIYLDNLCDCISICLQIIYVGISKYLDNLWMISICLDNLCDGISGKGNCKDGSDEDPLHCNSPTQVNDQ